MRNDGGVFAANLTRLAFEDIDVPTLVISAANCLYVTYDSSFYTAEEIANAEFVGVLAAISCSATRRRCGRRREGFLAEQPEGEGGVNATETRYSGWSDSIFVSHASK